MQTRVMVSSVCAALAAYREAAKRAIEASGMTPLLSEYTESQAQSSHNACLDLVESADIVVVLVGEKEGYVTSSGLTVVEEEINHARKLSRRILYFQIDAESREPGAERADDLLSNYVSGLFRKTINTPEELHFSLCESLSKMPSPAKVMQSPVLLDNPKTSTNYWHLYLEALPERNEIAIDPLKLLDPVFSKNIKTILHSEPELFSFDFGVDVKIKTDRIDLEQSDQSRGSSLYAHFSLEANGLISLSTRIVGYQKNEHSFPEFSISHFESHASKLLKTLSLIWNSIDCHERYDRLFIESALYIGTLGMIGEKQIHGNNVYGRDNELIRAFETPRLVSRSNLLEASEAQRISTMLMHKATEDPY